MSQFTKHVIQININNNSELKTMGVFIVRELVKMRPLWTLVGWFWSEPFFYE